MRGSASDVGGIPSATSIKKTVVESNEVIPEIIIIVIIIISMKYQR